MTLYMWVDMLKSHTINIHSDEFSIILKHAMFNILWKTHGGGAVEVKMRFMDMNWYVVIRFIFWCANHLAYREVREG